MRVEERSVGGIRRPASASTSPVLELAPCALPGDAISELSSPLQFVLVSCVQLTSRLCVETGT